MENRPQNEVYDCRQEKSAHTPRNQERTEPDVSFRTFKSVNQEKESYKKQNKGADNSDEHVHCFSSCVFPINKRGAVISCRKSDIAQIDYGNGNGGYKHQYEKTYFGFFHF